MPVPAFGLSNGVAPHEDPHACGSVVKIHLRPRQAQCERCNADVVQAACLVDFSIGLHRVNVLVK
jgi:hypothetical protein